MQHVPGNDEQFPGSPSNHPNKQQARKTSNRSMRRKKVRRSKEVQNKLRIF